MRLKYVRFQQISLARVFCLEAYDIFYLFLVLRLLLGFQTTDLQADVKE
jgi:hypothetical protein